MQFGAERRQQFIVDAAAQRADQRTVLRGERWCIRYGRLFLRTRIQHPVPFAIGLAFRVLSRGEYSPGALRGACFYLGGRRGVDEWIGHEGSHAASNGKDFIAW